MAVCLCFPLKNTRIQNSVASISYVESWSEVIQKYEHFCSAILKKFKISMEQIPLKHFTSKKQLLYILLFYFSLWQKRYRKPPSGGFQYLFIIHLFIWAIRPVFVYVQYRNVSSVSILANISPSGNAAIISIADANQDAAGPRDMIPRL